MCLFSSIQTRFEKNIHTVVLQKKHQLTTTQFSQRCVFLTETLGDGFSVLFPHLGLTSLETIHPFQLSLFFCWENHQAWPSFHFLNRGTLSISSRAIQKQNRNGQISGTYLRATFWRLSEIPQKYWWIKEHPGKPRSARFITSFPGFFLPPIQSPSSNVAPNTAIGLDLGVTFVGWEGGKIHGFSGFANGLSFRCRRFEFFVWYDFLHRLLVQYFCHNSFLHPGIDSWILRGSETWCFHESPSGSLPVVRSGAHFSSTYFRVEITPVGPYFFGHL